MLSSSDFEEMIGTDAGFVLADMMELGFRRLSENGNVSEAMGSDESLFAVNEVIPSSVAFVGFTCVPLPTTVTIVSNTNLAPKPIDKFF